TRSTAASTAPGTNTPTSSQHDQSHSERAEAKTVGATVFFCDEASVPTAYHSGATWGQVGRTPVVRGTGNRKSINMISAVSARGKLHFSFVDGNRNAESV